MCDHLMNLGAAILSLMWFSSVMLTVGVLLVIADDVLQRMADE